jgi:hypothetical protein
VGKNKRERRGGGGREKERKGKEGAREQRGSAFAFTLGQDPWSYLALSRAVPASRLLGQDPQWWCCGAVCPLTLSHTLPVPGLHSRSVGILVVVLYPPSPALGATFAQSRSLVVVPCARSPSPAPCRCKRAGQAKGSQPRRVTHICSSTVRGTGQDSEREPASKGHSRIVERRARDWSRQ